MEFSHNGPKEGGSQPGAIFHRGLPFSIFQRLGLKTTPRPVTQDNIPALADPISQESPSEQQRHHARRSARRRQRAAERPFVHQHRWRNGWWSSTGRYVRLRFRCWGWRKRRCRLWWGRWRRRIWRWGRLRRRRRPLSACWPCRSCGVRFRRFLVLNDRAGACFRRPPLRNC